MKRNLFAILVVVAVFVALVFVASPNAEAANGYITAKQDSEEITVSTGNTILNLNGKKDVVVKIENGVKLSVIDTSFIVDSSTVDLTGNNAGTLTVNPESTGTVAPIAFDGNFRYLAVEKEGTYSFHPFNLAITKLGVNTKKGAICLRITFIANDVVRDILNTDGCDYGIRSVSSGNFTSAKGTYKFGDSNGVQAYFDLAGSLNEENLDATGNYQACIKVNGIDVLSNYVVPITPRKILKTLNESGLDATDSLTNITTLAYNNAHLFDLFASFTKAECTHSAKTAASCVTDSVCKNCGATVTPAFNPTNGHTDANGDFYCDDTNCNSIVTTPNKHTHVVLNDGAYSNAWEITGTMVRPKYGVDQWNFGFDIYDESGKKLVFSATTGGIVFERVKDAEGNIVYSRYPYHHYLSQYNINNACGDFHQANNQHDTLYFKAVIKNDTFLAWFGYTEDSMVLSWVIPLAEELKGNWSHTDWKDFIDSTEMDGDGKTPIPFPGFTSGSAYKVGMHVNGTPAASGSINNIVIKTGTAVTTKVNPKFRADQSHHFASLDYLNGTLKANTGFLNQIDLPGNSNQWEISGTIDRAGTDPLNFGFMLSSGEQRLRMSAVTRGIVFEEEEEGSTHGRYPYHALNDYGTTTQYNFNTYCGRFLETCDESRIHFKAIVAGDMFYLWLWCDNEAPTLSWRVPLTERLTGAEEDYPWHVGTGDEPENGGEVAAAAEVDNSGESGNSGAVDTTKYINAFEGFADNSSFAMSFYTRNSQSTATISNFTVKAGNSVDLTWVNALTPAN